MGQMSPWKLLRSIKRITKYAEKKRYYSYVKPISLSRNEGHLLTIQLQNLFLKFLLNLKLTFLPSILSCPLSVFRQPLFSPNNNQGQESPLPMLREQLYYQNNHPSQSWLLPTFRQPLFLLNPGPSLNSPLSRCRQRLYCHNLHPWANFQTSI